MKGLKVHFNRFDWKVFKVKVETSTVLYRDQFVIERARQILQNNKL